MFSYMTVDCDPVGVYLAARCALHFESVVEGLLFGVVGLKIGDTENVSEIVRSRRYGGNSRYPSMSALRASASILTICGGLIGLR